MNPHEKVPCHAAAADADHMDMLALIITNMGYGHIFHPFPFGAADMHLHIQPMLLYAGTAWIINSQKP